MRWIRAYDILRVDQLSGFTDRTPIYPGEDDNYYRVQDFGAVGYEFSTADTLINFASQYLTIQYLFTSTQN
jgi:hypothetical protein